MSILPSLNHGSTSSSSSSHSPSQSSTSNHGFLSSNPLPQPRQSQQNLQISESPPPPHHLSGFPSSPSYLAAKINIPLVFSSLFLGASRSGTLVFLCFHLFGSCLIWSNFRIRLTLISLLHQEFSFDACWKERFVYLLPLHFLQIFPQGMGRVGRGVN